MGWDVTGRDVDAGRDVVGQDGTGRHEVWLGGVSCGGLRLDWMGWGGVGWL